jgi:hypothetical protein
MWGTGGWGVSPWGGGVLTGPTIIGTYAISDRIVHVTLDLPARAVSPTTLGDALCPGTWSITNTTSGQTWTILSVRQVSSTEFELLTLERLDDYVTTLVVATAYLLDASGTVSGATSSGTFLGVVEEALSTNQKRTANKGLSLVDVANPPTPNSPVGGTLELMSSGDYLQVGGDALLRKLVLRRLTTSPGEFWYLPDYGLGIQEKVVLLQNDVRALKQAIESTVLEEPDVEACSAKVVLGNNQLLIQLKVLSKTTGQTIDVGLAVSPETIIPLN